MEAWTRAKNASVCAGSFAVSSSPSGLTSTTRRTLDRWLARAGLAPARTLLACARVSAAFQLMSSGGVRTRGAAALLGYASPRALSRELQWLAGFGASAVPSHMTHAALVAALRPRLFRNATVAEPSY